MRFTERDGRLLHWINGHGFVTLRQVARWLGTNYQTAQLTKAAKDLDFIKIHDLPVSCRQPVGNQVPNHEAMPARQSDVEPLCPKGGCGQGRHQPPGGSALTASGRRLTDLHRIDGLLLDDGRSS